MAKQLQYSKMGLKPIQKWKTRVLGRRVLTILHFKWHPNTHHTLLPLPAFGTMGSVGRNLLRGCFSSGNGCQLNGQVRWLKELFYVLPVSSTARPTYAKTFSFKYNVSFPASFLRINNDSIYNHAQARVAWVGGLSETTKYSFRPFWECIFANFRNKTWYFTIV